MKNFIKWFGIIALVAIIGFSMTSCEEASEDDESGGEKVVSGGGTFTLTGIPSEYNGKYAILQGSKGDLMFYGFKSANMAAPTYTLVPIANGSVSLPMAKISTSTPDFTGYTGSDTLLVRIIITNYQTYGPDTYNQQPIISVMFTSVAFSNGSATKAWSDGQTSQ